VARKGYGIVSEGLKKVDEADNLQTALNNARGILLQRLKPEGYWLGHLSSSALATAIAAFALSRVDAVRHRQHIASGLKWLAAHVNKDGAWGDTPDSPSNLATALIAWSAFSAAEGGPYAQAISGVERWLRAECGGIEPEHIASALHRRYGSDLTFSVPILTTCALAGRLGSGPDVWRHVPQLPFELMLLPRRFFRILKLSVVSYAIPAMVAMGILRHQRRPAIRPWRWLRDMAIKPSIRLAESMLPSSGGYQEAPPLTSFVIMCLASCGYADSIIVQRGAEFLVRNVRDDGSWPIDLNLSVWTTSLAVKALNAGGMLTDSQQRMVLSWILDRQTTERHPFTAAEPGGWPWTHLPGGIPDADDTAGALVALAMLDQASVNTREAAARGLVWLMNLQNADGGIPTFCRGWGKLPFDRSCPDLTAHALQAFVAWRKHMPVELAGRVDNAVRLGLKYMASAQRSDGAWRPLWFGNQWAPEGESPVVGTGRALIALREMNLTEFPEVIPMCDRARRWLLTVQNDDGGWGAAAGMASSIEETAFAVEALAGAGYVESVRRGVAWLVENTRNGKVFQASPIGLYFAKLWFSEELYPLVFAVSALARAERHMQGVR